MHSECKKKTYLCTIMDTRNRHKGSGTESGLNPEEQLGLRGRMAARMYIGEVRGMASLAHADREGHLREAMYRLAMDGNEDGRVIYNALWCLSYLPREDWQWLGTKHDEMIDRLLSSGHDGQRRLLLTMLERTYAPREEDVRTDFLDFCLCSINSTLPYALRALCMKLAYIQCRNTPELLAELRQTIEFSYSGPVSPGIASARKNVLHKIQKQERNG